MNHLYRIVWNAQNGCWQAVCETAKGRGKTQSVVSGGRETAQLRLTSLAFAVAAAWLGLAAPAFAGPEGGSVSAGSASISQSGTATTINQSTDRAVINWNNFSVGANESVRFNQPSNTSATLNRVTGAESSQIMGSLSANGHVFILNPNGVLFGAGAQVNVGGLVASTLNMSDSDFMSGKINLQGESVQGVTNDGNITTEEGGTVVLIAPEVNNNGTITANQGSVLLAAANGITQGATTPAPAPTVASTTAAPVLAPAAAPSAPAEAVTAPAPTPVAAAPAPTATPTSTVEAATPAATATAPVASAPTPGPVSAPAEPAVTTAAAAATAAPPAATAPAASTEAPTQIASGGGNTADKFTVRLQDGSNIAFTIDQGAVNALVNNSGLIKVPGGQVILTAKGRDELSKATVNHSGVIEAQTITTRNGVVELLADMKVGTVNLSGSINAAAVAPVPASSATNAAPTLRGGFVETSAATVMIAGSARVNTLGSMASGIRHGNWLIDPNDFTIAASGGNISGATLAENLKSGDVTIDTLNMGTSGGNGDIFIKEDIRAFGPGISDEEYLGGRTWDGSPSTRLTLIADRNIVFSGIPEYGSYYGGSIDFINGEVDLQPNARGTTDGKIYVDVRSGGYAVRANNLYLSSNKLGSGLQRGSTQVNVNVLDENFSWQSLPMGLVTLVGKSPAPTTTKSIIVVDALDVSKTYNKVPRYGGGLIDFSGFLPGDDASIFFGSIDWRGSSQGAINVGIYSMIPYGLSLSSIYSQKYTIEYRSGTLYINPAQLIIAAERDRKVYDGGTGSSVKPAVTGLLPGDYVTGASQYFVDKNVLGENRSLIEPRYLTITNEFGKSIDSNYKVFLAEASGTVEPRMVRAANVRVEDLKTYIGYDDQRSATLSGWSAEGILPGDDANLNLLLAEFRTVSREGDVSVDAYWAVRGGDFRNYRVEPSVHTGRVIARFDPTRNNLLLTADEFGRGVAQNTTDVVKSTINTTIDGGLKVRETVSNYSEYVDLYLQGDSEITGLNVFGVGILALVESGGTVASTALDLVGGSTAAKGAWHEFVDEVALVKGYSADWVRSQKQGVDDLIDVISIVKSAQELYSKPFQSIKNLDLQKLADSNPKAKALIDAGKVFLKNDGSINLSTSLGRHAKTFVKNALVVDAVEALGLSADTFDFVSN